ncbi:MAG: hypothetical protein DHS20C10_05230 [marine bacterium B5-7]|nr:MAG: hypothetical protein DHS20C10_05230 [marine bacterium B5-7]
MTTPLKKCIIPFVDEPDENAQAIGAMSIDYLSDENVLSQKMQAHGCMTIDPRKMFYRQAQLKQVVWSA